MPVKAVDVTPDRPMRSGEYCVKGPGRIVAWIPNTDCPRVIDERWQWDPETVSLHPSIKVAYSDGIEHWHGHLTGGWWVHVSERGDK